MKTNHSIFLFLSISFLSFSINAYSADPQWPVVSAVHWDFKGNHLHINWNAGSDEKGIYYIIEKSRDGKLYSQAGLVLGGFSRKSHYEFTYRIHYESGTQYRVIQVNKDGQARQLDLKSF